MFNKDSIYYVNYYNQDENMNLDIKVNFVENIFKFLQVICENCFHRFQNSLRNPNNDESVNQYNLVESVARFLT